MKLWMPLLVLAYMAVSMELFGLYGMGRDWPLTLPTVAVVGTLTVWYIDRMKLL